MLQLSRKTEYALMALVELAGFSDEADPVVRSRRSLSEAFRIPAPLLGKILQALTQARLLESTQGIRGGYRLSRPADQISLREVLEAVDGPFGMVHCQSGHIGCKQSAHCNIRHPLDHIQLVMNDFFSRINLRMLRENQIPPLNDHETKLSNSKPLALHKDQKDE